MTTEIAIDTRRSVVSPSYKMAYALRAQTARGKKGVAKQVLAESNGDWLARELALFVRPSPRAPFDVDAFDAICAANEVDLSKLPRNTPNWQGRLSMNGRQMLRVAVARHGELRIPGQDPIPAPKSFIAKYKPASE